MSARGYGGGFFCFDYFHPMIPCFKMGLKRAGVLSSRGIMPDEQVKEDRVMAFFNRFVFNEKRKVSKTNHGDIIQNLNHILNTKRQYGSFLDNYGIRDLNAFYNKEDISKAVIQDVLENIERFEKRIEIVEIKHKNSSALFQLSFIIECRIRSSRKSLNMNFDTAFNSFTVTSP